MSVVESGVVRPGGDVLGELSLVSRGEEMFEVAHMELDNSVTEISGFAGQISVSIFLYLFCLYSS